MRVGSLQIPSWRRRALFPAALRVPPDAGPLALAGLVIFAASWLGIELTSLTGRISVIWIANAIAIAYVLNSPRRMQWPLIAVATLAEVLGDVIASDMLREAVLLGLCNTLEIVLLVVPLRRLAGAGDFSLPRTLTLFYGLAAGPAAIASAVSAGLEIWVFRSASFWPVATHWYLGDALGLIVLVPPLVTARGKDFVAMFSASQLGGTLLALAGLAVAVAMNASFRGYPFAFLFFPAVLLLTFMRGFSGGTLGILIADLYLVLPATLGHSATLKGHSLREQLMIVLGFAAVLSFTVIVTGAALAHRRRLERGLAEALSHAQIAREEAIVAKDAAENANRSKSMFLANMSHELRTPLNAVIGFSEVMSSELFGALGNPRYKDYATLIHSAGSHLLDLINDILDMSKIEAGKFEIEKAPVELRAVAEDCLTLMQERADAACVRLVRAFPAELLTIQADRRALKQILLNLLSNAVKFTPEGGTVTVQILRDTARGRCSVRVSDTGVGIPAEAIARLGNPFVQARGGVATTHQGTGLGLALVRALTQMHDGTLKIESIVGAGTTVSVELPAGAALEQAA